MTRHLGELVIQRSDIPLSAQNITRMKNGNAPFVRAADGSWEPLQLHHVGRKTAQMIEVTTSQNAYNSTGGPLHIRGPGSPVSATWLYEVLLAATLQGFCECRANCPIGEWS